ncbi:hypothetical protein [Cylindrospermopsis curvispora]|uniref:Uncharacterized protein n=1 Tax=Cylindrospermopsis curvispora GIHE-G1 TaxID=2666332 RepID=A0A7H0EYN2_9CYAN|nr:hypothetical protein [Cylindrospermopsis curvispora]QNP28898.1 hypothetical protein IAR63_13655 [Cylindrospermopsis curvispora GIHE-G1]
MTFLIHKRANNRNNRRVMSKIFNVNKFYLYSSSIHKLVVRSCYGRSHHTPNGRLRSTRTREIAFSVPPGSFSREKPERVDKRSRSTPYRRLRSTRYARSHYILNGRLRSTPFGRSRSTPYGISRGTTYYLKYHEKGELG